MIGEEGGRKGREVEEEEEEVGSKEIQEEEEGERGRKNITLLLLDQLFYMKRKGKDSGRGIFSRHIPSLQNIVGSEPVKAQITGAERERRKKWNV